MTAVGQPNGLAIVGARAVLEHTVADDATLLVDGEGLSTGSLPP